MSASHLAVLIPCYRGAGRIGATLRSLQQAAPGIEVVVVDDGSDDGTEEAARRGGAGLALTVVRHRSNRGRAAARNTGLSNTAAEWVLLLDDDMEARTGMIAAHRTALGAQGSEGSLFLGRLELPDDIPAGPFTDFLRREEEDRHRKLLEAPENVHWRYFQTGQVVVRRSDLVTAGGFDERFDTYGFEDTEMGIRLARAGVRLRYLPDAISVHRAYALDLDRFRERAYLAGQAARHLAAAHPDDPEVRRVLRLDGMGAIRPLQDSAFQTAMKTANRALVRQDGPPRLSSGAGERLLLGWTSLLERLPLRRLRNLTYHVVRDVSYYHGIAAPPAATPDRGRPRARSTP